MPYISLDKNNQVNVISTSQFNSINDVVKTDNDVSLYEKIISHNKDNKIRLAYICNWKQKCGISTYSEFIFEKLKSNIDEYKIFSEHSENIDESENIKYCWTRGTSLKELLKEIKDYKANVVLIQHEWGLFPNATFFMSFIIELKKLNIAVLTVLHSVYEHIDKTIPLSILDNVIVHSNEAKNVLIKMGFKGSVNIISHGCPELNNSKELWNIFQNDYTLFGFGFGFKYKGVDMAIDAIKYLKDNDPKFKNILYIYVCSESNSNKGIHNSYYDFLTKKVDDLDLSENVLLIKGFLENDMLDRYLRIVKMVIFPYVSDPDNTVYGASGAIKIAMSYNLPVIASQSHLFDDLNNIVERISNYIELATEIDKIFSNDNYKNSLINKTHQYINEHSWEKMAILYLDAIKRTILYS